MQTKVEKKLKEDLSLEEFELMKALVIFDNPLISGNSDLVEAINKGFDCNMTKEDLYYMEYESINQMSQDRMLISKHNNF